ncbi:hypothetical protein COCOBI_07-2070 [Coccomyxa sp. Obi]|nr:hypothetical protein COCOBI_07-2070 [Coccomyxa sp. Obi]
MQPSPFLLLFLHLLIAIELKSARAQVNVNVGPLGDTHKHRWYVWLIVSIAGTAFLISLFWTIRGMVMWRRRVRAVKAQRAAALGVTPDKVSANDEELGLFDFWKPSTRLEAAGAPEKGRSGRSKPGVVLSEEDAQKLKNLQRGTAAQREAERQYRTGQHPSSAQLLHHLRRVDSF